jgi:hypothetical protein
MTSEDRADWEAQRDEWQDWERDCLSRARCPYSGGVLITNDDGLVRCGGVCDCFGYEPAEIAEAKPCTTPPPAVRRRPHRQHPPGTRKDDGVSTKTYPISVALSVASGKLMCEFPDLHEAVTDLAGWPVMTHHMGNRELMDAVAAKVIRQVSWMPDAIENMPTWSAWHVDDRRDAIVNWLAFLAETCGPTVTIDLGEPLPAMGVFDGLGRLGTDR